MIFTPCLAAELSGTRFYWSSGKECRVLRHIGLASPRPFRPDRRRFFSEHQYNESINPRRRARGNSVLSGIASAVEFEKPRTNTRGTSIQSNGFALTAFAGGTRSYLLSSLDCRLHWSGRRWKGLVRVPFGYGGWFAIDGAKPSIGRGHDVSNRVTANWSPYLGSRRTRRRENPSPYWDGGLR